MNNAQNAEQAAKAAIAKVQNVALKDSVVANIVIVAVVITAFVGGFE